MRYTPIIMTGESVRGIRDGKKTQTRRVILPEPEWRDEAWYWRSARYDNGDGVHYFHSREIGRSLLKCWALACPFGRPGDRLWVKETWAPNSPPSGWNYRADDPTDYYKSTGLVKWRSSLFMPRVASRLTLEIDRVQVQQLHAISPADVLAEGVARSCNNRGCTCWRDNFRVKWNKINATGQRDYPWLANPWVWVITFRKI